MLDIKWIRDHPEDLDANQKKKGAAPVAATILQLDASRRRLQTHLQELQSERNTIAKSIGEAKKKGLNVDGLTARSSEIKDLMPDIEEKLAKVSKDLDDLLGVTPNLLDASVPEGSDESVNQCVRSWGMLPTFDFQPLRHFDLGEKLGLMDFKSATKMAGSQFTVLKGALARLERSLILFMLDVHTTKYGYTEVSPPLLVRDEAFYGVGQLPKFAEDLFQTTDGRWLVSTAEVPLSNLVRGDVLSSQELPMRWTSCTPCFRSETGAAGEDTLGMIRQHQFYKVELVSIVTPDQTEAEHERMTDAAEEILRQLGLPYRVMLLCSGDTGLYSQKTYDLEVWLPGEGAYREISSCSRCGDYQARRMNARYRTREGVLDFVHTLNGSGVAVGRALVAVLENYQQADGSVLVPHVLRPYMGGLEIIEAISENGI